MTVTPRTRTPEICRAGAKAAQPQKTNNNSQSSDRRKRERWNGRLANVTVAEAFVSSTIWAVPLSGHQARKRVHHEAVASRVYAEARKRCQRSLSGGRKTCSSREPKRCPRVRRCPRHSSPPTLYRTERWISGRLKDVLITREPSPMSSCFMMSAQTCGGKVKRLRCPIQEGGWLPTLARDHGWADTAVYDTSIPNTLTQTPTPTPSILFRASPLRQT